MTSPDFIPVTHNNLQSGGKSRFDPLENIRGQRTGLAGSFMQFYRDALGYQHCQAEPLVPTSDASLLFTNSTIVALKGLVTDPAKIPQPGIALVQDCLRLHNLNWIFEEQFVPNYCCYFQMLGALAPQRRFCEANLELAQFLKLGLGIPKERIHIELNSGDTDFHDIWRRQIPAENIRIDAQPKDYYEWEYGVPEMRGRGITFCLEAHDGRIVPVGNIISLSFCGKTTSVETALGLKTALCAMLGHASCIDVSICGALLNPQSPEQYKLADLLPAAVVVYREGVQIGHEGRAYILKKLVKAAAVYSSILGLDPNRVAALGRQFEAEQFGSNSGAACSLEIDLKHAIEQRNKNRARFINEAGKRLR